MTLLEFSLGITVLIVCQNFFESYQGGEMTMMKSVFQWRKPEYPEETTDLRQVTDETFHTYGL